MRKCEVIDSSTEIYRGCMIPTEMAIYEPRSPDASWVDTDQNKAFLIVNFDLFNFNAHYIHLSVQRQLRQDAK